MPRQHPKAPPAAVEQALEAASGLLALLEEEAAALAANDLSRLEHLPAEKQPLLTILEKQQALLQGSPLKALSELRALLEQCQAANQRNGRVIHSQQSSTQQMLAILRGGEERPPTYGTSALAGRNSSARSRPLGSA